MPSGPLVLVVGGAGGIGARVTTRLAEAGHRVVVADRTPGGPVADFAETDLRDKDAVQRLFRTIAAIGEPLVAAVNTVGVLGPVGPFETLAEADWQTLIDVNLSGLWRCMVGEADLVASGGSIVNVASVAGMIAAKGLAAYGATKQGVVGLTRTAAAELAIRRIRVNAVCPGYVDTHMLDGALGQDGKARLSARVPLGRLGEADEVAAAICWLCGQEASYITGQAIVVDGGLSLE